MLPMAQTIWYIPSGLDIWNQKINKAPGHYTRMRGNLGSVEKPPEPVVYWADQEPLRQDGPLQERLSNWLTLVHRGQVIDAYRTFLGLMEDVPNRKAVLAELVFAGLIDVQDRMLFNRSYTTGHKAYRARSTVEIGNASAGMTPRIMCCTLARWIWPSGRAGLDLRDGMQHGEDAHRGRGIACRAVWWRQRSRGCGTPQQQGGVEPGRGGRADRGGAAQQ